MKLRSSQAFRQVAIAATGISILAPMPLSSTRPLMPTAQSNFISESSRLILSLHPRPT